MEVTRCRLGVQLLQLIQSSEVSLSVEKTILWSGDTEWLQAMTEVSIFKPSRTMLSIFIEKRRWLHPKSLAYFAPYPGVIDSKEFWSLVGPHSDTVEAIVSLITPENRKHIVQNIDMCHPDIVLSVLRSYPFEIEDVRVIVDELISRQLYTEVIQICDIYGKRPPEVFLAKLLSKCQQQNKYRLVTHSL